MVNGTTGKLVAVEGEMLLVACDKGTTVKFGVHQFHLHNRDGAIRATRSQYPINLAWALTIHKAQGMTLDQCTCDLQNCFVEHQAYVAISRCRDMDKCTFHIPVGGVPALTNAFRKRKDCLAFYNLVGV